MYLYIGEIIREQCEDDIENLLVVAFRIGIIAVRNRTEEGLQEFEHSVNVFFHKTSCHVAGCIAGYQWAGVDVSRNEGSGQTYSHLFVWNAERIASELLVVVLYRDISALVEKRHDCGHALCWSIKVIGTALHLRQISG